MTIKTIKTTKRAFFLFAVVLALAGQTRDASAQATSNTLSLQFPIVIDVFVPCAAGGAGEVVVLSGILHELIHVTIDVNGALHSKLLDQPQGVSGFGQTSGAAYRGTGASQQMSNTNPFTFVNNFRIIGQGPNNNFLLHQFFHVTVTASGEFTATVDFASVDCQ
jgi:hypothetical protein